MGMRRWRMWSLLLLKLEKSDASLMIVVHCLGVLW